MYTVKYYKTRRGEDLVKTFKDQQPKKAQTKMAKHEALLAEHGPNLHRPYADYLRDDIYELRVKFSPNNYRILYFFFKNKTIIMTHGIIKNRGPVGDTEIDRAIKYKREFEEDYDA